MHRRTLLAHGSWRRVTRRIVCGLACALTVRIRCSCRASRSRRSGWTLAASATKRPAGPTGDAAGTWSWDGADDMKLNGYDGGAIKAAGKLNIAYEGQEHREKPSPITPGPPSRRRIALARKQS